MALDDYGFCGALWKVAFLLHFGGEKFQVEGAERNFSHATFAYGLV